jgi:Short C-terminal domain/Bacterial PH domain
VKLIETLPGGLGAALAGTLTSSETVLVSLNPNLGEGIAVTDQRVIVLKAGSIAGAGSFGKKAITYTYSQLTSVEHREGPFGGHIKLLAAGVEESGPPSNDGDNCKRENVVTYSSRGLRETMREVVRMIQEHITSAHSAAPGPASAAGVPDLADQLLKLSTLHAQGVLSDAEFAAAKARLIGS